MFLGELDGSLSSYVRWWCMWFRFERLLTGILLDGAVAICLLFCMCGCGVVPIAPESHVERNLEILDKAMTDGDWRKASSLFHSKMSYETATQSLKGSAAIKAFLRSIRDIRNMNEIHTHIQKMKRLDEKRVAALVTMQAHVTLSSMTLRFSNSTWQAKMLWVRVGPNSWKLASLKETTARARASASRGGV